jgi:valine dehydrogenase (NAD+)
MRAAAEVRWGSPDLSGRHVTVSGVGKVGRALVDHLIDEGATVTVADIRDDAVRAVHDDHPEARPRLHTVAADQAHAVDCDIFAPCALGAVLHEATIPELRCEIVAGSANNQLAGPDDDQRLVDRDILYVPDYVANAGGVINIAEEPAGYDRARAWARIEGIHDTVLAVLERSRVEGIAPGEAADRHAETRIATVGAVSLLRTGRP